MVERTEQAANQPAPGGASERIVPATIEDFHAVVEQHARYWGDRDLRPLHIAALVQEFPATSLVAVAADGIRGYIFGFVAPGGLGYVHLVATRDDSRGTGLGRRLYAAFMEAARAQGARRLKAITSVTNAGSIAFHRGLGFDAQVVEDYDGPGRPRVVFTRALETGEAGAVKPSPADKAPADNDDTPGEPELRPATVADLPAIKALIDAAYAKYLTRMSKPPAPLFRDYGPSVEAGTTWVTGSPIEAVLTLYLRDDHAYVENVAVDPGAQGRGLGRALMTFAELEATRHDLTRMALVTHEAMTENQAIYARLGYVEVGRRAEDGYRRIHMEKRLSG